MHHILYYCEKPSLKEKFGFLPLRADVNFQLFVL